jgi:hypothetical protein
MTIFLNYRDEQLATTFFLTYNPPLNNRDLILYLLYPISKLVFIKETALLNRFTFKESVLE